MMSKIVTFSSNAITPDGSNTVSAFYDYETSSIWFKCSDLYSNIKDLPYHTYTKKFTIDDSKSTFINESGLISLLKADNKVENKCLLNFINSNISPYFNFITSETKLHYDTVQFIKNNYQQLCDKIIPGLGELQDTAGRRVQAFKKGYSRGQPDIMIPLSTKYYNGLAIEIKSPKYKSGPSEKQKEYHNYLSSVCGWKVIVSYDQQFLETTLKNYLTDVSLSCQRCKKYYVYKKALENHLILNHYYLSNQSS